MGWMTGFEPATTGITIWYTYTQLYKINYLHCLINITIRHQYYIQLMRYLSCITYLLHHSQMLLHSEYFMDTTDKKNIGDKLKLSFTKNQLNELFNSVIDAIDKEDGNN